MHVSIAWTTAPAAHSYPVHVREPTSGAKHYRGDLMRHARTIISAGLSAALLAVSASSADARWGHRGSYGHGGYYGRGGYYGGGPGLVGGVVVGALTLATLPFAILGAAASPAPPPPPPAYNNGPGYGPAPYGYGPPPTPRGYNQQYGPQTGYNQQYGSPPGYSQQQYGPPPGYYNRQYGPPPGYYDGN